MSAVDVHALVEGPADAPAVVLSSSLGTTTAVWDRQVAELARSFRVIRYDLRGHGSSPVPPGPYDISDLGADIVALLDRLGVERADLAGLSIGGMASMWVAAFAPGRVRRLVLCSTSARFDRPDVYAERAAAVRANGSASVAAPAVMRWFTPGFIERRPDVVARMEAMVGATPAEGYAACCEVVARTDLRPILSSIAAPTLLIAGRGDVATPPANAHRIAACVPHARVVEVDDAGHIATIEQPARVTSLILEHLAGAELEP